MGVAVNNVLASIAGVLLIFVPLYLFRTLTKRWKLAPMPSSELAEGGEKTDES